MQLCILKSILHISYLDKKQINLISIITVWLEEPVMTILDSTTFPIDEVEFPTVTLCPKSSHTNRGGPVIKVLDYMKVTCPVG